MTTVPAASVGMAGVTVAATEAGIVADAPTIVADGLVATDSTTGAADLAMTALAVETVVVVRAIAAAPVAAGR